MRTDNQLLRSISADPRTRSVRGDDAPPCGWAALAFGLGLFAVAVALAVAAIRSIVYFWSWLA